MQSRLCIIFYGYPLNRRASVFGRGEGGCINSPPPPSSLFPSKGDFALASSYTDKKENQIFLIYKEI
jgi:hypothetical protein